MKSKIYLKITSPVRILFEGDVKAVSAENKIGAFDVLEKHANFISLLNSGNIKVWMLDDSKKDFKITKGIIKVANNKVYIFVNV